jgi:hypothetical protein
MQFLSELLGKHLPAVVGRAKMVLTTAPDFGEVSPFPHSWAEKMEFFREAMMPLTFLGAHHACYFRSVG